MSRRRVATKREIIPDPRFGSVMLTKFMNMIMESGKKSVAEGIVYGALDVIGKKGHSEPLEILSKALENVQPRVEVKSRRVGGATYQVPVEVRPSRRLALAMRWLIDASRKRNEKNMSAKLAGELIDAFDNRGSAAKKREDTHRMAEANKAFSHYRW
ncbi:MAG: 30S ribosomal protein S7 [Methylococcaceae bacterium]|jgi:small subunit ribosomal protein S7|uniref:30S ribosomal protein S7 n=1 Tax=Pseudomonadota TaxID=1224 RepID=UPI00271D6A28|nr:MULTISPECIES: 30S ribosomal protein S7 [Pseudomonadota]MDD2799934.1 30S ribosomal protein S7 [Methylococcales bacterium]MDD5112462.1 30S ribosomal protein S7 [Methylobacter sp.]MDP2394137.1 30S ribosomal protein S7 [Methylococcaceae bacterium]MDO9204822.1 30S ribosomal protein S7 [Methylotenera sp.]MDP3020802.1 30S ribosomal protein S7 [Methylococcaceae bacterium]